MRAKGPVDVPFGDAVDGSPCETCRHRDRVDRGYRVIGGSRIHDFDDVCMAPRDRRDGRLCFRLAVGTVPESCAEWDMAVD